MKQVRFIPFENCGLQVRDSESGQESSRRVVGKPIIYGVRSRNLTPWSSTRVVYEILEPDCISNELLQRSEVLLNLNHSNQVQHVLGRYVKGTGTLGLTKREGYIEAECELPETSAANDTLVLIKRGDITGMSFAFQDDWEDTENGVSYERTNETVDGKEVWLRHVKRITGLFDVSIVTTPAYEQTTIGTREAGDEIDNAIEAQLQRELNQETEEERQARETVEKAEQEKREAEAKAQEEKERLEREAQEKEALIKRDREVAERRSRQLKRWLGQEKFSSLFV